jgi:hypothetical protein
MKPIKQLIIYNCMINICGEKLKRLQFKRKSNISEKTLDKL